jgi:ribonuclease HI
MAFDPRALQIHTDGSAFRNPGHVSGFAVIARYPEHMERADEVIFDFGCPKSTNQRMELKACVEGLKWVRHNAPWDGVTCVLFVTDSRYVREGVTNAPFWKKSRWRNRDGKPIFNADLWDELLKARAKTRIRTEFVWEMGKTTDIGKRVDNLAKAAARRGGLGKDGGYNPGAYCRSMVKGGVAVACPVTGQIEVIRPFAKKPLRKVREERVSFNLFDEVTQTYSFKFYAFTTLQIAFELHRWRGWRVQFNDNPKYPQITDLIGEVSLPPVPRKHSKPRPVAT